MTEVTKAELDELRKQTPPIPHNAQLIEFLSIIHGAARVARLRIQDGRAREAMALFEHSLAQEIEKRKKP